MALFQIEPKEPYLLESVPKLSNQEFKLDPKLVRIQEAQGFQLIFYKDFKRLMEQDSDSLFQIVTQNNLDVDRVGIVIEEVDVINNPHYLNDAKNYVNPKKVYIRPMSTKKSKKICEEALEYFEKYNDSTLFDNFIENPINEDVNFGEKLMNGLKNGVVNGAQEQKEKLKADLKSGAVKTGLALGGIYGVKKLVNWATKKYADEDAKKHPDNRSMLIKKLRILRGKLPEYESKYQRAEREKWENRGIIGKIIYKIKTAIANILHKLKG